MHGLISALKKSKLFTSIEEIKAGMARGGVEDLHERNSGRKPDEIEALIEEAVKAVRNRKIKQGDKG